MWTAMGMPCRCPPSARAWSAPRAAELAGAADSRELDRQAVAMEAPGEAPNPGPDGPLRSAAPWGPFGTTKSTTGCGVALFPD